MNSIASDPDYSFNSVEELQEMERLGSFAVRMGYSKVGENYVRTI